MPWIGAIAVARDYDGLKQAALELLEESRSEPQNEKLRRVAEGAANREQILQGIVSHRTLAEGYYMRISYLLELESMIHIGVDLGDLEMSEMYGLASIQHARREFDSTHPLCTGCQAVRLEQGETRCPECSSAEMRARAAQGGR